MMRAVSNMTATVKPVDAHLRVLLAQLWAPVAQQGLLWWLWVEVRSWVWDVALVCAAAAVVAAGQAFEALVVVWVALGAWVAQRSEQWALAWALYVQSQELEAWLHQAPVNEAQLLKAGVQA